MSVRNGTSSSQKPPEHHPRNAAETKKRILIAARTLFSQDIYKNVGTRSIAAAAGVNITLINRYFGSKKKLFNEVVHSMGHSVLSSHGEQNLAREVMTELLAEDDNPRKEKLRLLLLSAMDPEVSDVVSEYFLRQKERRARFMKGDDRDTRAFLGLASLVGISLSFFLLPEENRSQLDKNAIVRHFTKSLEELYSKETEPDLQD
ncbi:TetR/AcrR family transcriptional regulator [Pseudodesulfovibrio piezophilus]|uniref:Putative Transcriptional regulator, TetR family n=1 Tax=Pseudodesulfovibrio piezophilus (strain DSM 21447 / JCM 15486 / C1TLV30) TaxID=1322246 RepID=M1WSB2_PSEP2|nr:TetR/AcrR family transcriptional regulator [Pseudodesulfovibrio piezophilus]CCH50079.1 putative Transcriptional regulator, TetR family [Pseudodesulfovibrio piezophilus C1TLV30]